MNIPKLRQQKTIKKYHGISWEDNYAWIHQENILEVLKNPTKLNPEVQKYLEKNNEYTDYHLKDTKKFQKKLFDELNAKTKKKNNCNKKPQETSYPKPKPKIAKADFKRYIDEPLGTRDDFKSMRGKQGFSNKTGNH